MPARCLVVPCYNEAGRLDTAAFLHCLDQQQETDLCFVNDGSSDRTTDVLQTLRLQRPTRIHLLDLARNQGKAEAVRQGCLHVRAMNSYRWLGYWDADLATPLDEVELLVRRHDEVGGNRTLILGSRIKRLGAQIDRTTARHITGRVFATFASMILGLPVYDSQCGAKLISPTGVDIAFAEPFLSRWLFDVEILARLRNHFGMDRIEHEAIEVPLETWREKGNSRLKWSDYIRVPAELWKLRQRYNVGATLTPR